MTNKIIVMEDHDDLYYYWKLHNINNIDLVHLDPHCDLSGALVNSAENYMLEIKNAPIDEGNFLVFAIKEGTVRKLKWIYDEYGGRRYDDTSVKFETDLTGKIELAKVYFKKPAVYPIDFSIEEYKKWSGLLEGEHLSLDWDLFAFNVKDYNNILKECHEFISRNWTIIPEYTYVCYSQEHVHPSLISFLEFIEKLKEVFKAEVEYFRSDKPRCHPRPYSLVPPLLRHIWRQGKSKGVIWLHQRGIF